MRVAQHRQDARQAVVGTVGVAQADVQQRIERLDAIGRPIAHGDHRMVALLEDVAQPDTQHRAHAGAFPVPMRLDMRVDQIPDAHLGDDTEQQRQAIDLLGGNGQVWWCHAARVTHPCRNLAPQMRE